MEIFPDYNWDILQFDTVPKGTWDVPVNQAKFLASLQEKKMTDSNNADGSNITINNNEDENYYNSNNTKNGSSTICEKSCNWYDIRISDFVGHGKTLLSNYPAW